MSAFTTTSASETWEYDTTHPKGFDTLKGDNLNIPQSHLTVEQERRLSSTNHKSERPDLRSCVTPGETGENSASVLQRRRSSVLAPKRRTSRKATGSFGGDDQKPLSSLSSNEKQKVLESQGNDEALYFADDLPKTTYGSKQ